MSAIVGGSSLAEIRQTLTLSSLVCVGSYALDPLLLIALFRPFRLTDVVSFIPGIDHPFPKSRTCYVVSRLN